MNSFISSLFFIFVNLNGYYVSSFSTRFIVDGNPVLKGQLPFIVSLQSDNGKHLCGGSIISRHTVLTAAHCFDQYPKKVVAGVVDFDDWYLKQERSIDISSITIHPKYSGYLNDLAIFKVVHSFYFSSTVNYIEIDRFGIQTPYSNPGFIAGWGSTDANDNTSFSSVLLGTNVNILSQKRCVDYYGEDVIKGVICTLPIYGHEDACQGDSGGPLIYENRLTGIVSSGYECGNQYLPAVYMNVSFFSEWINNNM